LFCTFLMLFYNARYNFHKKSFIFKKSLLENFKLQFLDCNFKFYFKHNFKLKVCIINTMNCVKLFILIKKRLTDHYRVLGVKLLNRVDIQNFHSSYGRWIKIRWKEKAWGRWPTHCFLKRKLFTSINTKIKFALFFENSPQIKNNWKAYESAIF
jgi:hypothetical protein